MKQLSLRDRLVRYLKNQKKWVASGDIQRLVVQETKYTPRTAVRRLEELANEGLLTVKYMKGHAYYKAAPTIDYTKMAKEAVEQFNNGTYLAA